MEHDRLQLIESRAETLLQELKEDNHSFIYSTALFILVALYLLAIVFLYIKSGFSILLLIYIIMITGMLAFYKMNMNRVYAESATLLAYKKIDNEDKVNYVAGMLRYLVSGFDIKLTRVRSVRMFYTILFPLFLLIIREIFIGPLDNETWITHLPIALLMGGIWYIYFTPEEKILVQDQEETRQMIQKIYS